jgi:predicted Rossmann fold nucleotide-binding protein DprA/Smf involved in DNA uptake
MENATKVDKDRLKALRQERAQAVTRAQKAIKEQNQIIKAIKAQIKDEGRTIPDIAQVVRMSTSQVLLYVATLKKYGEIIEDAKDGDYFKYRLAEQ